MVRAGNSAVSNAAQALTGIGVKRQVAVPITSAVAAGGNRVSDRENVSGNGDNHNHTEEVLHSDQDHRELPSVTGRLERPVNRQ